MADRPAIKFPLYLQIGGFFEARNETRTRDPFLTIATDQATLIGVKGADLQGLSAHATRK
jgi:hypothetical protein